MIIVDYKQGNNAPALRKYLGNISLSSVSFGDIQINNDKITTDAIVITSWNKLDKLTKSQMSSLLTTIKKKKNSYAYIIKTHIVITGNSKVYRNNQKNIRK